LRRLHVARHPRVDRSLHRTLLRPGDRALRQGIIDEPPTEPSPKCVIPRDPRGAPWAPAGAAACLGWQVIGRRGNWGRPALAAAPYKTPIGVEHGFYLWATIFHPSLSAPFPRVRAARNESCCERERGGKAHACRRPLSLRSRRHRAVCRHVERR